MKKSHLCICATALLYLFSSCEVHIAESEDNSIDNTPITVELESMQDEILLLTNKNELNLLHESNEDVVDWELSREFAEFTLVSFMSTGEFPKDSSIWDLPVAIYDSNGDIKYYEYRITSQGKTVGAITCNANEKNGAPIAFIIHTEGYADEIEELYKQGKFTRRNVPRLIDNGYPNVVLARANVKNNGTIQFDTSFDLQTGETVSETETPVNFEEYIKEFPNQMSESQINEVRQAIKKYQDEMSDMWEEAKKNKGNIMQKGWGGSSSSSSGTTSVDQQKPNAMSESDFNEKYGATYNHWYGFDYYACGGSAAGYVLDTLALKGLGNVSDEWLHMSNPYNLPNYEESECVMNLIDVMNMEDEVVGISVAPSWITWPSNIGNAISKYSDYNVSYVCGIPKKSIDTGIPGISLRIGAKGFHYRNVVAYESRGWWIFKWDYELIKDLNRVDGGWEAWNPFYHWMSWNVVHK
ncbi:MAG: hypothetical protein J6N81_07550 [Treponema sp.]|nr:hypothetical protein [Treponema sp.]MBO6219411.1 hypothetical protein [Treponema sp.]